MRIARPIAATQSVVHIVEVGEIKGQVGDLTFKDAVTIVAHRQQPRRGIVHGDREMDGLADHGGRTGVVQGFPRAARIAVPQSQTLGLIIRFDARGQRDVVESLFATPVVVPWTEQLTVGTARFAGAKAENVTPARAEGIYR